MLLRTGKLILFYLKSIYRYLRNQIIIFRCRLKYSASIGRGCRISPDFVCGKNVKIGDYTVIGKNVVLKDNVKIGGNTILKNISVDESSHIEGSVRVIGTGIGSVTVGKESYIGFNITIDTSDSIIIGDFVHLGSSLWSHSSARQVIAGLPLADKNPRFRPTAPTVIENNVYLGINSTINPGITIGHHSIITPNSSVTKDVEPYSMVGGVPAKIIRKVDSQWINDL